MLAVARESRGFTQTGLARELEINQSTYSRHESGATNIDPDDLRAAGSILDYPIEFFSQPDLVWGFASPVFYHRKGSRLSVGDLRIIQAKLNVVRFHVTRLWPGVDIDSTASVPFLELDDYGTPERAAELVRCAWKLPMGPVVDLIRTFENAGIVIKLTDFGTNRLDAVVQVAPDAPPVILVNKFAPGDRLRFTLAHELGHLVMHSHPSPTMEDEANQFASEFLMPRREIKPLLRNVAIEKLPDLKLEWKVSMAALIKRASDIEAISERHARTLFMRMSSNGWRLKEPCPLERERPHLIHDVLRTYFVEYRYSVPEIARAVNSTESSFRADYLNDDDFTAPRLLAAAN
jgi:Zn-dependent peptidase ImmA (M78 family)